MRKIEMQALSRLSLSNTRTVFLQKLGDSTWGSSSVVEHLLSKPEA